MHTTDTSETVLSVTRRRLLAFVGWGSFAAFWGSMVLATLRFFFPRILYEPAAIFQAGKPDDYFDCLRTVASLYSTVPIGYAVSNDTGEQAHCAANAWSVHAAYVMSSRTGTRCTRSPRCPCVSAVPSSLASIFFPRRVSITRNHVASNDSVW